MFGLMLSTYCVLYTNAFQSGCNVVFASAPMFWYYFPLNTFPPREDSPPSIITSCTLITEDTSISIFLVGTGIRSTFQSSPPAGVFLHLAHLTFGLLQLLVSMRSTLRPLIAVNCWILLSIIIAHKAKIFTLQLSSLHILYCSTYDAYRHCAESVGLFCVGKVVAYHK